MNREHHPPIKILEYNHIINGIYIGTNLCCQFDFDEKLKTTENIDVDISLEAERVDQPFGINFYVWLPVKIESAPSQDQLEFGTNVIEKCIEMKKKIYIHCQNGHGRAPTLVAAYLIKKGKSIEEALDFIKKQRSSMHLHPSQKKALENFSKNILKK